MNLSICKPTGNGHHLNAVSQCASLYNKVRTRYRSFFLLSLGIVGMVLTSCGSEKSEYQFKTAKEGIDSYREFYKELKHVSKNDMASISMDIKAWLELEDSVEAVILRDTASTKSPHFYPHESVRDLHNSVRDEFLNRAMAQPRTLQDVLTLKTETSLLSNNQKIAEAVGTAAPFFQSLDSVSLYNMDCSHLLSRYQSYLSRTEKTGIHDKQQLQSFLREEDRLFRSFVTHLSEMNGKSATNITKTTERIYAQLPGLVTDSVYTHDELFMYLTMRTNRRLLVTAQGCLADIKASKVKTPDQKKAYLLMILQPFTSINDFGIAMLTDTQKATFAQIAKEASPVIVRLAGNDKAEREHVASLPDLMIKIYLSTL